MAHGYVCSQESLIGAFAAELGKPKAALSEDQIRHGMALYAAVVLPITTLIEHRINELDVRDSFEKFNYEAELPSHSTGTVQVGPLRAAPTITPYRLPAGFTLTQDGVTMVATSDLHINVGETVGTFQYKAIGLGTAGTPRLGDCKINRSVAWIQRTPVRVTGVVPGRDGQSVERIQRDFGIVAQNPDALITEAAHADYVQLMYPGVGRVVAKARARTLYEEGKYNYSFPAAGHLTIAVLMNTGRFANLEQRDEIKRLIVDHTIPYGEEHLHIVPLKIKQIQVDSLRVKKILSADAAVVQKSVFESLQAAIDWRSWPAGKPVLASEILGTVSRAAGVAYVDNIVLQGRSIGGETSGGGDDTDEGQEFSSGSIVELYPYELPVNGIFEADIEVS